VHTFPNWIVPANTVPTWMQYTCSGTATNTIIYQTWTQTTSSTWPMVTQAEYEQIIQQQNYQAMLQQQMMAAQQERIDHEVELQARRDYAATEAARVIEPARASALDRARSLLLSHLNEEQRRTFEQNKWFVVEGGRTKQRYRIRDKGDLVANVEVIDMAGNVMQRLCAHGLRELQLPLPDHFLTQKLMLENDEDAFLRVANRH
jgi:hypothetical protein